MDSKTKHRILGVLVVIGLGVLVYPLLQSGNDMPSEQVLVKAPPFPDQSSPLNAGPTPSIAAEPDKAPEAATPVPLPSTPPDSSASAENVTPDDAMSQQPDDTIAPKQPNVINVKAPDINVMPSTVKPAPSTQAAPTPAPAPKTDGSDDVSLSSPALPPTDAETLTADAPKLAHQAVRATKAKKLALAKPKAVKKTLATVAHAFNMPKQDDSNGLLKLNQVAYVIQVGSFKQKGQALHLVNQLRENGYRAFIQQVPGSDGSSTQVFVGPENHQHLARALATQLQSDMNVKGIVISYQPFTL